MKRCITFFLSLFCFITNGQTDEIKFKEYSYSELFEMIESETDSIFELENAIIKHNDSTDNLFDLEMEYVVNESIKSSKGDLININIALKFVNVHFLNKITAIDRSPDGRWIEKSFGGVIQNIQFNKPVKFQDCGNIWFYNCSFNDEISFATNSLEYALRELKEIDLRGINFQHCDFYDLSSFYVNLHGEDYVDLYLSFENNKFHINESKYHDLQQVSVFGRRIAGIEFVGNTVNGFSGLDISSYENQFFNMAENDFDDSILRFVIGAQRGFNRVNIGDNVFNNYCSVNMDDMYTDYYIGWDQFNNKLITDQYMFHINEDDFNKVDLLKKYADSIRIVDDYVYELEITIRSKLFRFYKEKLAYENANSVYVEIKDLETRRLEHMYKIESNFNNYFRWKINRFLKVFSNYGTEPQRAIIFSFYVILLFAGIYLFFPNTWDEHGRKRIMDRYAFFIKYMKRDAGIHEVYLEEKQQDLLEYEEFKTMIEESGKSIPRFFLSTGYPLYKWAVLGTKTSARWLKRLDIVSGKWSDLPKKQKPWKSVLLIGAFIIALAYDLLIKVLNALMLSVNTFTTLGFGEIPIKGLPRYLAIIQGFIGWFMLTIFSVSLISQLLLN